MWEDWYVSLRLPQTEFSRLNFFPDPMKPASDSFEEVWGKETSEKDRLSYTPPKSLKRSQKSLSAWQPKLCDYVVCMECLEPRCLYLSKRLTHSQYVQLQCYKSFCILVVVLSFLKKAFLLHCVVWNLLVAVMRTLPQLCLPPDHHVAMCVVPLATYVQCWMKWNVHISECILSATNVLLWAKRRGQEVLDLQEGIGKLLSLDCRTFLQHMVCYLRSPEPISFVHSVVYIYIFCTCTVKIIFLWFTVFVLKMACIRFYALCAFGLLILSDCMVYVLFHYLLRIRKCTLGVCLSWFDWVCTWDMVVVVFIKWLF